MSKTTKTNETKPQTTEAEEKELYADTNYTAKTGHLVRDAELVSEGNYVKMRFATNQQYPAGDGEIKTKTNFFDALLSKHLTKSFEVAQNLKRGDFIYIQGEDRTKTVKTLKGYNQTVTTIFANLVELKKAKAESPSSTQEASSDSAQPTSEAAMA